MPAMASFCGGSSQGRATYLHENPEIQLLDAVDEGVFQDDTAVCFWNCRPRLTKAPQDREVIFAALGHDVVPLALNHVEKGPKDPDSKISTSVVTHFSPRSRTAERRTGWSTKVLVNRGPSFGAQP